jgi:PPP family 3-phenylpropionic acid transporter
MKRILTILSILISCSVSAQTGTADTIYVDVPAEVEAIGLAEFVQRNKLFMIMSLGIVLLFFGNVVVENFTIQIVENIGGNTEQMGFVIFLLSIFEMPAMLGFNKLKEKFSYVFLLRVAAVFFSLKIIMMFLAGNMFMIYLAQLNQVLGYGLLFPALVSFIDHIMDKREAVRGQAVFTVALTVGNVFGSVLGGIILDAFSVTTLLGISSVLSVIGSLIIMALINKIRH